MTAVHHDIGFIDGTQATRLQALDDDIARLIDIKCGRSFGGESADTSRTILGPHSIGQRILPLPVPIRSVDSVTIDGDTVDDADYELWHCTREGDCHALRMTSAWPSRESDSAIVIDGVWSDTADGLEAVPSEIVAAATFLVAEEWKLRQSSATGEIGPDGMVTRPRNPWNFEIVKTAIDQYRAARPVVMF